MPSIPAHKITKWVTLNENLEERQLPRNVIVGGNFWDTTAYICRGFLGRVLGTVVVIPGAYHPTENICYLGQSKISFLEYSKCTIVSKQFFNFW